MNLLFFSFFQNSIKFISTGCLSYSPLLQADENPSSANDRPLPFLHSNLRSEHKQLQHSWQKPGVSQASLPLLRLKLAICFYSPESAVRVLLSPFPGENHSFHQGGMSMTLKADTLWPWSHLSPQANQNQTWSEFDLKVTGKSGDGLWLITWAVPFLICSGDFRRDHFQKCTPFTCLPRSPYGICSLLYRNL